MARHSRRDARKSGGRALALLGFVTLLSAAFPNILAGQTVTEFQIPTTSSKPDGITAGPDGNLWFTEQVGNRIGQITPSGAFTEFSAGISASALLEGITAGPDGNLWFTEINGPRIGRITPSGVVNEFSAGITVGAAPMGITAGPDGNLWFTEYGRDRIGQITPLGVVLNEFGGITAGARPHGITAGPCVPAGPVACLWFTEEGDRIGRITTSGVVTEFGAGITAGARPIGITAGPDGNLWFTEYNGQRIGQITPSGVVTEFSAGITSSAGPNGIAAGPDGNLWFTEANVDQIGRIDPLTGFVSELGAGITGGAAPFAITAGPDGNLWFTEQTGSRIARITLKELFAANFALPYSVTVYARAASGNVAPLRTIQGAATGMSNPSGIAVDMVNAELLVTNVGSNSITVYALTARGNVAPLRTLSGVATGLSSPTGVTLDTVNDEIAVANPGNQSITVYSRTASGNVAPLRTISGAATGLVQPRIVEVDTANNELAVVNTIGVSVTVYARTASGNAAPLRTIKGAATGLSGPFGVAVNTVNDELTVANSGANSVTVYSRTANGNVSPLRTIAGAATGLNGPTGVIVDLVNDELVVVELGSVASFARMANGNVAPLRTLSGPATGLSAFYGAITNGAGIQPPTISKAFGAPSIVLNGSTSLSFTINNPNASTTLTGVGFTDALPAGLVVSTPNGLTGSCGGGIIVATAGSGAVSLARATLAANVSCSFSVNVTGTTAGVQNNTTGNVTSIEGGNGGTAAATLTVCPVIVLAPASLPGGTVGSAYSQTITASGGASPYTFTKTSGTLPSGLSLSSGGVLSGTPTASGSFTFAVTATDANACTGSQTYTVGISSCPSITLSPSTLPNGANGTPYSQTITASGGVSPYTFTKTSGALPTGLSLSSGGVLSGTPTASGSFTFAVTATDANACTGSQTYTVGISCPSTITLVPTSLPGGSVGVPYNQTINAVPSGNYTFAVISGSLPAGLTLTSGGVLSGTPTTTGASSFTITATDVNKCIGTQTYSILVSSGTCSAPSAPVLSVKPANAEIGSRVTLSWTGTLAAGKGNYVLRRSINGGGYADFATVPSSGASKETFSFRLPSAPGVDDFRVLAVPACNPALASISSVAEVNVTGPCPDAPVVTGLAVSPAVAAVGDKFTLTWNAAPGFTGLYGILLSADGGQTFTLIGTTSSTTFTGTVAGTPGTTLTFAIEPQGCVYSQKSNFAMLTVVASTSCKPPGAVSEISIRANAVDPARPPAPTEFISVAWTPPVSGTAPTGYSVRINGDAEVFVGGNSATLPPRGADLDPVQVFVGAQACDPAQSGPETSSGPVALFLTPPAASFAVSAAPRAGQPILFTDTSAPQATSWLWIFDDGATETTQAPSHSFTAAGSHFVSLVATNSAGSSTASQTVAVAAAGAARVSAVSSAIAVDSVHPGRRRAQVAIGGRDTVFLRLRSGEPRETVVFLRFLDSAGRLRAERRLSVGGGGEGTYDLGAYGPRGEFTIELVSDQIFQATLWHAGRAGARKVER